MAVLLTHLVPPVATGKQDNRAIGEREREREREREPEKIFRKSQDIIPKKKKMRSDTCG